MFNILTTHPPLLKAHDNHFFIPNHNKALLSPTNLVILIAILQMLTT